MEYNPVRETKKVARTKEILALRWTDIEQLDDYTQPAAVTITGTVDRRGQRQEFPKSESGYRTLLLPEFGRQALLAQRERGSPFDLIFPSRTERHGGRTTSTALAELVII
jgi:hypothetical protein